MLEVMQFIFQDFWTWLGTVILLYALSPKITINRGEYLMDTEKLIERLRTESLYADKASLEIMDLCMESATALSMLHAENEKLRGEVETYRNGHCAEGGCAAEKDRDAVLADLGRVAAERDALIKRTTGEYWTCVRRYECNRCWEVDPRLLREDQQ